ncbi:hypothetical protein [Roseateles sp.]|uniref:hypothetical protein n=1 Tax=Roseateles sp. TaxID=1971397 RepID=UPI0039EB1A0A
MRQLLLSERATPDVIVEMLGMEESVWEDGHARVMLLGPGRPLAAFWLHYYGSSAEMLLTPEQLPRLLEDIDHLLRDTRLPPQMTSFLRRMRNLCARALQAAATMQLSVIAD